MPLLNNSIIFFFFDISLLFFPFYVCYYIYIGGEQNTIGKQKKKSVKFIGSVTENK